MLMMSHMLNAHAMQMMVVVRIMLFAAFEVPVDESFAHTDALFVGDVECVFGGLEQHIWFATQINMHEIKLRHCNEELCTQLQQCGA